MALKPKITNLNEVTPELQGFYKQAADGFALEIEGIDIHGILSKNAELLSEKKAAQAKAAALEQAQQEAQKKLLEEQNQYQTLYKQAEAEKAATAAQLEAIKQQRMQREREIYVENFIKGNGLVKEDMKRFEMLKRELMNSVNLDENGSIVTDGLLVGDSEAAKKAISEQYPFLVDAVQSTGGGAVGGSGVPVQVSANPAADAAKAKGDLTGYLAASLKASLTTPTQ